MPRLFSRTPSQRTKLVRRAGPPGAADVRRLATDQRPFPSGHYEARESGLASASASAYEVLLVSTDRCSLNSSTKREREQQQHPVFSSQHNLQRAWLAAADARQPSWTGERPSPRKLVKEPSGSARPSTSQVLLDSDGRSNGYDGETPAHRTSRNTGSSAAVGEPGTEVGLEKGIRRKMARWRELRW